MKSLPTLRRYLAGIITLAIVSALALFFWPGMSPDAAEKVSNDKAKAALQAAWPLFGGTPGRNMVNTVDKNIPAEWYVENSDDKEKKPAKNIKWKAALGSQSYSGPVVSGGKVFVGTNNNSPRDKKIEGDKGVVMCFRESDGKFLWQITHDKLPSGQVNDWPEQGVCSTPVVEGNRLYYVSNRCEVVCADTEGIEGKLETKIHWTYDMMKELDVFPHNLAACSPVIAGDLIFVVTANGVDENHINIPAPKAPSFIALNKKSGKLAWQNNLPTIKAADIAKLDEETDPEEFAKSPIKLLMDRGEVIMHGQWSNPTFAQANGKPQVIFPGGDGWLYAFEPEKGELIWKFDANPKDAKYALGGKGTRSDFISTPVVVGNRLYIGTGQDPEHVKGVGHLWCLDITKKGDVSPDLVTDAKASPPKTKKNPNSAVVWHFGGSVPEKERETLKRNYYFSRTMSTCAIHDGLLYITDLSGRLYCLDSGTGKEYWFHDTKSETWGSPYWVDGKIYVGNDEQEVNVFQHGKVKKQLAKNDMPRGQPVKSTPVAANGTLYIMTTSHLYAIEKK